MNKKEVQKRVLQHGKPLALSKFTWDEKTNTFSTEESNLVIDFYSINYCTFTTGDGCTFKTRSNCTFKTWSGCTFTTWSGCTFDTGYGCTFKTGEDCVILRCDTKEIIKLKENQTIKLNPYEIKGYLYLENGKWYQDIDNQKVWSINVDGILSRVISKKGNIYKVKNHNENNISYIIQKDGFYSHGKTIKEAKEDLKYKLCNQDTSEYKNMNLDTILTFDETLKMYKTITGACSNGMKYFVTQNNIKQKKMTIKEIIELTKNQYGNNKLQEFFNKENK